MPSPAVKQSGDILTISNTQLILEVDLVNGTWSGFNSDSDTVVFESAQFHIFKTTGRNWKLPKCTILWTKKREKTPFGGSTLVTLTFTPIEGYDPSRMLTLRLFDDEPFVEVGWGIANSFDRPVRIKHAEILSDGRLFAGQKVTNAQVLNSGAGADSNFVEKGWQINALNGMMLTYKNGGARQTLVAGGLAYTEFARRVETSKGRRLPVEGESKAQRDAFQGLTLSCWDPQGKLIQPGETYVSPDTYYIDFVTSDPFEALERYGNALRVANNATPNPYDFPTLCGWMVSTTAYGEGKPINNSRDLVEQMRIARDRGLTKYTPLAVRLEPDAYCYGNFGDTQQGWWDDAHWGNIGAGNGTAIGKDKASLRPPYDTFAKFCKAVTELGGIPFTYFQSSMPSNDFAVAHPEWMLNNDISELHVPHPHQIPFVRFDYTDPGFRKHCLKMWKRLRKAGMKGIKFDYPETAWASGGGFEDSSFTTTSAYCELFRLCREGLGPDAYIHERILGGRSHEFVPQLDATAGIVDLQRVWGDASHFEPEMASRIGLRWYKSRNVFIYYPDGKSFIQDGKVLPDYKRRAFLTLIAFLAGRLEIGTSLGTMTDDMFHDTTRLFPIFDGTTSPRPIDLLKGNKHPEVYLYEVTSDWHQVLLINNNKSGRKTVSVPLSGNQAEDGALGLDPDASYHAFDFWSQSYLGLLKGKSSLSMSLRGGETAMISLRKQSVAPQMISTNRHIMQGMVECHGVKWSEKKKTLSGKVDVIGGEPFVLTVACNGSKPTSCDNATIRKVKGNRGLIDLVFESEESETKAFKLTFA